jgi:hypothetical protein
MTDLWPSIKITKIEAAQRQLDTALRLWFDDADPVPIHVLAFSAYDVIHAVSKKRNPFRPNLLFDTNMIKAEFLGEWAKLIKTPSGFFKHARNDPEGTIDFRPQLSELLMTFAIRGLAACEIAPSAIQAAFLMWRGIQDPSFFSEEGRKLYLSNLPIETIKDPTDLSKRIFLNAFIEGRRRSNQTT